jgi:hypothetical protein
MCRYTTMKKQDAPTDCPGMPGLGAADRTTRTACRACSRNHRWKPSHTPVQASYSAGNTASTPFFFSRTTTNFAGFVLLALRPTVCTSPGPS